MKTQKLLIAFVLVIAGIFTVILYPKLPAVMPGHWNAAGDVDGYVSKNTHVIMFLGLCVALPIFMTWIPKLDPKYKNIRAFEEDFGWFIVIMTLFMTALYGYTTAFALGYQFPIQWFIIPAMSVLFYSIGVMLAKAKSNYTIGIRLPWTLNSEANWNETHQLAAKTFKYGALLFLITVFFGKFAFAGFMSVLLLIVLIPIVYSYQLHKKGV